MTPEQKQKLQEVRQNAEDAFWSVVADSYPEVKSGDFPPDAAFALHNATEHAIKIWLEFNHPDPFYIETGDDE